MRTPTIVALVLALAAAIPAAVSAVEPDSDFSHIAFSTHENSIKLFDTRQGRIYIYNEGDGKLVGIWQIRRLGDDLENVPVR